MPGDYDIEYTSPWAGANFLPYVAGSLLSTYDADTLSSFSTKEGNRWEKGTWPELARLAKDVPEAGIHFQGAFPSTG
jgi:hypothetical protein